MIGSSPGEMVVRPEGQRRGHRRHKQHGASATKALLHGPLGKLASEFVEKVLEKASSPSSKSKDIVLTKEDVEIPERHAGWIKDYAEKAYQWYIIQIPRLDRALANFETTIRSASLQEGDPDILDTVVSEVIMLFLPRIAFKVLRC